MSERLRPFVAAAYLFFCLLLGGSAQGVWGNALLRLLAILIIAWALLERRGNSLPHAIKQLLLLFGLAIALALMQLIPLPTSFWASLPGRAQFANGFRILGVEAVAMPISLAPYDSLVTLLALLPPLGMIAAMVGLRGSSVAWLAATLIVGTTAGVLLGILQVTSADPLNSSWYLYPQSSFGIAAGFFANSNHMASLLLATIPFIAALGVMIRERAEDLRLRWAAFALVVAGLLVVILGLLLNGSLAGYGLGVPVVLASLWMLFGARTEFARGALAVVSIASLVALAMLWVSPVNRGAATSVSSRQAIFSNGVELLGEFGPIGTGLGTFEKVYRLRERPDRVDQFYVNHAHNDYLELAIEFGLPGIILMLLFFAWWGRSILQAVQSPAADQFAFAGVIASAALLLHSAVDYPLRTAAMSTVFAMCLVLIVQSRRTAHSDTDLRPARHLIVS
jgi:O-antigen ligase